MQNEELIQSLRSDAEWAHGNEWETPITIGDHLDAAADALEAADAKLHEQDLLVSPTGYVMDTGNWENANREIALLLVERIRKHKLLWKLLFMVA